MAANGSSDYNKKLEELITIIRICKMRLMAKYGPSIRYEWEDK